MRARRVLVALAALAVGGCATIDLRPDLADVRRDVGARTSAHIAWHADPDLDAETADAVRALLAPPLTADAAVQVSLLGNREIQVTYAELGLARADLVQAGLLKNPLLDAAVFLPLSGVRPDLQISVVWSLLDALLVPLRARVAAAAFEDAKLRVIGAVLELASQVRAAFYAHQGDVQLVELHQAGVQALAAAAEVSRRQHEAGNRTDLDLARDRALVEASKLALRSSETAADESRERLNALMGAWGEATGWRVDPRLSDVLPEPPPAREVEREAIERSIDLARARQQLAAAGRQLGYDRATALVSDAEAGPAAEREGEEAWKVGPTLRVPILLFDQGQARVARAEAELRRARHAEYALAVRIRAAARAASARLAGARDRAAYYRAVVLPLHERIVADAQRQYNAMQIGVIPLLRERERQIDAAIAYVQALREYWLAHTTAALLASGRMPDEARTRERSAR